MEKKDFTLSKQRALKLYIKLMRASNRVTKAIHRQLHTENLTHSQFAILEALLQLGPLTQGQLSRKILKSNANVTTVVDSLEKKALVGRLRFDSDRRKVTVQLTDAGQQLIQQVFPRHVEVVEQRLSVLTPKEQDQLAQLLKKLGLG